jgi:hypothetical protein
VIRVASGLDEGREADTEVFGRRRRPRSSKGYNA